MALAGLRGNLPGLLSSSSSSLSLSSQKLGDGLGSTRPLTGDPGFKLNSPAVTVGSNPGQVSSSGTQTGPHQHAEKVKNFEEKTGVRLNDIKTDIINRFKVSKNPSEASQKAFDAIFERFAEQKGRVIPLSVKEELHNTEQHTRIQRAFFHYANNPNDINVLSNVLKDIGELKVIFDTKELPNPNLGGGRKTFTRKYKNRKYKVSSKRVRKSSHKRNTYRNKRHSRRH